MESLVAAKRGPSPCFSAECASSKSSPRGNFSKRYRHQQTDQQYAWSSNPCGKAQLSTTLRRAQSAPVDTESPEQQTLSDFEHWRSREVLRRPCPDQIDAIQSEVTPAMRTMLVDWLGEVRDEFHLQSETLFLSVSYLDRFLSVQRVARGRFQLVGLTCLWVAAKFEEVFPPPLAAMLAMAEDLYSAEDMRGLESEILFTLDFGLSVPTPLRFMHYFLHLAKLPPHPADALAVRRLAEALLELTVLDSAFMRALPSHVAASAVSLALGLLQQHDGLRGLVALSGADPHMLGCLVKRLSHVLQSATRQSQPCALLFRFRAWESLYRRKAVPTPASAGPTAAPAAPAANAPATASTTTAATGPATVNPMRVPARTPDGIVPEHGSVATQATMTYRAAAVAPAAITALPLFQKAASTTAAPLPSFPGPYAAAETLQRPLYGATSLSSSSGGVGGGAGIAPTTAAPSRPPFPTVTSAMQSEDQGGQEEDEEDAMLATAACDDHWLELDSSSPRQPPLRSHRRTAGQSPRHHKRGCRTGGTSRSSTPQTVIVQAEATNGTSVLTSNTTDPVLAFAVVQSSGLGAVSYGFDANGSLLCAPRSPSEIAHGSASCLQNLGIAANAAMLAGVPAAATAAAMGCALGGGVDVAPSSGAVDRYPLPLAAIGSLKIAAATACC